MEILIPGLILVGFMIWASTRIKRNAARAFEREEIETDEFSMTKPEGTLAPVDPADGTIFSAYSKDFGADDADRLRQATIEVRRFDDVSFAVVCERAKMESSALIEEQAGVIDQHRSVDLILESSLKGVPVRNYLKIIAADTTVYQLAITVLESNEADWSARVSECISSFSIK